MLVGIGRKFSRDDPKILALPYDTFHSFRNTSVLYRFGGRLSGTPFFNLVLGVKVAVSQLAASSFPGVTLNQSWDRQHWPVLSGVSLVGWCCRVGLC